MKKVSVFSVIFLLFAVSAGLSAQSRDNAFHVSQVRSESRNNLVRLTWLDSPDARGPVYIYRSARPFSGSIPQNIKPVVVRYGIQYYIDDVEDMTGVFYLIAASNNSGHVYEIIIPQVNSVNVNLAKDANSIHSDEKVLSPVSVFEPIPGITNIMARRDGDRIVITFTESGAEKNTILYRSMQPVKRPEDLLKAVIVKSGIISPFMDFPVPGQNWYYAIVYEDEISNGNIRIRPGINATVSAVIIYDDGAGENFLRPIPLPVLTLNNYVSGSFLPETSKEVPLSAQSLNMLKYTQSSEKAPLELKKPRVFSIDLQSPASGEESELFNIIKDYFGQFEWEHARDRLQDYLSLSRSRDVEARGRFYLGQTYYYSGNYREALWEFLFFRNFNPGEANSWIDAVLSAMVY